MDADYNQKTQQVIEHITQQGRCTATQRVYLRCFKAFGDYLLLKGMGYSAEEAKAWLSTLSINKTDFNLYSAAISKLNDLYAYGEIHNNHYDPARTIAGKLCPEFQHILEGIMETIASKADDTVSSHSWQCASILLWLQDNGISCLGDIRYDDLLNLFFSFEKRSYYSRCGFHENLKLILQFGFEQGLLPFGFTLFVGAMVIRTGYFWNNVNEAKLLELKSVQGSKILSLEQYMEMRDVLYSEHRQNHYSDTALKGILRITNLFYLFMDMNNLCYSPLVGNVWLDSLKSALPDIEHKHFRRILSLLEKQYNNVQFPLNSYLVFRETQYERLPDWCRPQVDAFLKMKTDEGWTVSTIQMYRSCVCRFCISVHKMGIRSFEALDAFTVKQFNLEDRHKTPEGKNAYNSRIRKFLEYLGENHATKNPFLFLSLSCLCAARETLVITLTEEEQQTLRDVFQEEDAPISLREKAMIQLGLYMGIRGIDIVSLTVDNIDWEKVEIRVVQEKTDYEINLPMPVPVANAVYRYIMEERPESSDRSIFIRTNAPYNRVGKGACLRALNKALPDRNVAGSGFHVTRKTYATNLLNNDVSAHDVAEALGHRGLDSVHKYLSLEESGMRKCGLNLSDKGLLWEGGFCHV